MKIKLITSIFILICFSMLCGCSNDLKTQSEMNEKEVTETTISNQSKNLYIPNMKTLS